MVTANAAPFKRIAPLCPARCATPTAGALAGYLPRLEPAAAQRVLLPMGADERSQVFPLLGAFGLLRDCDSLFLVFRGRLLLLSLVLGFGRFVAHELTSDCEGWTSCRPQSSKVSR